MKAKTAIRILRVLGTQPAHALTTVQIQERWLRESGERVLLRNVQRYMVELSTDADERPAIVKRLDRPGESHAYYLLPSQVASWFMTEEAALQLLITRQIYGRLLGDKDLVNTDKLAEQVVNASPAARRIRARVAVVPDGIGRLSAVISHEVLAATFDAIAKERMLDFRYESMAGNLSHRVETPLGLVAKDGTVYLVAVSGLNDAPRHYALHRMTAAEVSHKPAQDRPKFVLATHILETHQFSHVLGDDLPLVRLKLRVHRDTLFHFRERWLHESQEIAPSEDANWSIVTATIPKTIVLRPFLASMGPGIEVLEPADVREEIAEWVRGMHDHYAADVG